MASSARSISPLLTEWPTSPAQNNAASSSHYGCQVAMAQTRNSTPDLMTSPASSMSSISSGWSMPLTDLPPRSPSWVDLNPQAQSFVPGSLLMHSPILSTDQLNAQLISSVPADYLMDTTDGLPDFKLTPLSQWDTFSEEPLELLEKRSHLPQTPAYPPDLRPLPTSILKYPPPPAVPPSYLALIADCLRHGTQEHDIESSSRLIITSRPRWNLESLLELSERICFEMYNPCTKPADKHGRVIRACDSARYIAVDPTCLTSNFGFFVEYERGAQRQHAIAIMVKHLNQHLLTIHSEEVAQLFMWHLRESVLTRFRETWDIVSQFNTDCLFAKNDTMLYRKT
jgi:hypothetical protein